MKKLVIITYLTLTFYPSIAQKKVSVCYDKDFDFGKLKTFDFSESSYKLRKRFKHRPYIAKALIEKLVQKGMEKTNKAPDAIVDVQISFRKMANVNRRPYNRATNTVFVTSLEQQLEANLIVNIVDNSRNELVWTGSWVGLLQAGMTPDRRRKRVEKTIKKLFKKYPGK